MSDTINQNGKTYIEISYLEGANKTALRRKDLITLLITELKNQSKNTETACKALEYNDRKEYWTCDKGATVYDTAWEAIAAKLQNLQDE